MPRKSFQPVPLRSFFFFAHFYPHDNSRFQFQGFRSFGVLIGFIFYKIVSDIVWAWEISKLDGVYIIAVPKKPKSGEAFGPVKYGQYKSVTT